MASGGDHKYAGNPHGCWGSAFDCWIVPPFVPPSAYSDLLFRLRLVVLVHEVAAVHAKGFTTLKLVAENINNLDQRRSCLAHGT